MICPRCEEEFGATRVRWLGAFNVADMTDAGIEERAALFADAIWVPVTRWKVTLWLTRLTTQSSVSTSTVVQTATWVSDSHTGDEGPRNVLQRRRRPVGRGQSGMSGNDGTDGPSIRLPCHHFCP